MDPRPFYRAMGLGLMAISVLFPVYALAADGDATTQVPREPVPPSIAAERATVRTEDGAHEEVIPAPLARLRDQALAPVVQLNRNCSATVIHSDRDEISGKVTTYALTAKHCVDSVTGVTSIVYMPVYDKTMRLVREEAVRVKVHGVFWKHDLALLRFVDTGTVFPHVARIAAADVALVEGEPTVAVGYPFGMARTKTAGELGPREDIKMDGKELEYIRSTPGVAGGNSGGALFRITEAGDYELIGVTSLGAAVGHINAFVPVDVVHEYVDGVLNPPVTTSASH
jgi:S1-C subfamily serine protease